MCGTKRPGPPGVSPTSRGRWRRAEREYRLLRKDILRPVAARRTLRINGAPARVLPGLRRLAKPRGRTGVGRAPERYRRVTPAGRSHLVIFVDANALMYSLGLPNLHFSPLDGRSTRYDRQDFVALACRAQRTVQVRLRAPSGSRLALTALSRTSPRRVVRNAG